MDNQGMRMKNIGFPAHFRFHKYIKFYPTLSYTSTNNTSTDSYISVVSMDGCHEADATLAM